MLVPPETVVQGLLVINDSLNLCFGKPLLLHPIPSNLKVTDSGPFFKASDT